MRNFFAWVNDPKTPAYIGLKVIILSVVCFAMGSVLAITFKSWIIAVAPFVSIAFFVGREYHNARKDNE